jgi:hypothetical protein
MEVKVSKIMVKELNVEGKSFVLVKLTNGMYGAVAGEYITDGKTNKVLNGVDLYMNATIEGVIEEVKMRVAFNRMYESGMTVEQIYKELYCK